jgi:tousled-like kinase
MHNKSTITKSRESNVINKIDDESLLKGNHLSDVKSTKPPCGLKKDQIDVELDQDKRTGKRKNNYQNPRCVRKRRQLCLQKSNIVNQLHISKSAGASPNPLSLKRTNPCNIRNQLAETEGTPSCTEAMETEEVDDRVSKLKNENEELCRKNRVLEKQLEHYNVLFSTSRKKLLHAEESLSSCRQKLIEVLRQNAAMERKHKEERLERDCRMIGRIVQRQNSLGRHIDVWEDGERFLDLQAQQKRLGIEMEGLSQKKKELSQLKKKLRKNSGLVSPIISPHPCRDGQFAEPKAVESLFLTDETHISVQAEVYSLQTQNIKRKQSEFEQEFKELKLAKHRHVKFIKMMNSEMKSLYKGMLLNNRYLCTALIGRGGFSEVWKGYDLESHRYVACKIHALNEKWADRKKENFTRHATREAHIQKGLCHPRIVKLYDVFEIDANTFCTVLELCEGTDLDAYLKAKAPLPEREARSIITQLFEGLMYLTKQKQPIIHYDLKPGNILHIAGQIKITDFGLSKILLKDQFEMELTSQGAGTYWYLPPECFITSQDPPMIGTGVDMWSGGCILYEMLYGQRPFGHNMSQEKIMREGTLLQAHKVDFPVTPKVTDEAKDLIEKCLSRNQKNRPDPLTILEHPFFSKLRPART